MTLNLTCPLCCLQGFSSAESLCSALVSAATRKLDCPVCNDTVVGLDKLTIHLLGHVASDVANFSTPTLNNVPCSPTVVERLGQVGIPGSENPLVPNPVLYFTSDSGHLYAVHTDTVLERAMPSVNCTAPEEISNSRKFPSSQVADGGKFSSCKELLSSGDFTMVSEESDAPPSSCSNNHSSPVGQEMSQIPAGRSNQNRTCCDVCDQPFSNVAILAVHKQLTHTSASRRSDTQKECEMSKKRPLICNWCPSTFNLRSSLVAHVKVTHAGQQDSAENQPRREAEKLTCQICGKTCPKEGVLHQHMKMAHGEKPWQCAVCSKSFTTKYFLRKHKRIHTGETPYECSICHKVFTFQQSYHKHMLYHTDNKPYCCSHCGRLFKELSTLNNHERIHSGEKPFACENCGKAFRQRVSYLVHRRIHTGAMPYQCTACNKSFRYKISQRTHKCSAQPPGVVVKTQDSLVARLQAVISKEEEKRLDALPGGAVGDTNNTRNDASPPTKHLSRSNSAVSSNELSDRIDVSRNVSCDEQPDQCSGNISSPTASSFAAISQISNSGSSFPLPSRADNIADQFTTDSTSYPSDSINGFTTDSNTFENIDSSPTECLNKLHISSPDYYEQELNSQYIPPQQNLTFDPMDDIDLCNFLLNFS